MPASPSRRYANSRASPGSPPGTGLLRPVSVPVSYGTPVTVSNVKTVEKGEEELKQLGFRQFRVRFHDKLVRVEIAPEELEKALSLDMAAKMVAIFKPLGFHYVTLDLEGYRQGALNEALGLKKTS